MKKTSKIRNSANSLYDYYRYPVDLIPYKNNFKITEAIHDMASEENWFPFLDIICLYKQKLKKEIWQFSREDQSLFTLTGTNESNIPFTEIPSMKFDFFFDDMTIIKKGKFICFPLEEKIY